MNREARRGLRTATSIAHIVCQVIILYLMLDQGTALKLVGSENIPRAEIRLLQYICASLTLNAINYSVMKMLSHSHTSSDGR